MAYIWNILWLFNNYSLATPPHNSGIIQAFQQAIEHAIQWLIYEYHALCYVLLLSFCSVWFQISTPPTHVKLLPNPLQNPAYFSSYLHNTQVVIQPYSEPLPIVIPYLFCSYSHKETQRNDSPDRTFSIKRKHWLCMANSTAGGHQPRPDYLNYRRSNGRSPFSSMGTHMAINWGFELQWKTHSIPLWRVLPQFFIIEVANVSPQNTCSLQWWIKTMSLVLWWPHPGRLLMALG